MIFLGWLRVAPNGAPDWVVYHTGSSPIDKGTVKKVSCRCSIVIPIRDGGR
jgi:hypothetical protein